MWVVIYIFVGVPVSAAILAFSVWLTAGATENPFRQFGTSGMWARCFGLVIATMAWQSIADVAFEGGLWVVGATVSLVLWFGGLMVLFERTLLQAVLLTIANRAVAVAIGWMIGVIAATFFGDAV